MAALLRLACLASLMGGLVGCAVNGSARPEGNACLGYFYHWDQRIDAAGVRNPGAHRIPGFPWLRSTRFSASFREALSDAETDAWADWLEFMRKTDIQARIGELANAGAAEPGREQQRLESCGRELNRQLLVQPERRERLLQRVAVPVDYSLLQRLFGAYPLALPFLLRGIADYQAGVLADYARPTETLKVAGTMRQWRPPRVSEAVVDTTTLPRNALGLPDWSDQQWLALVQAHAPTWWIETGGAYDWPGQPQLHDDEPGVNPQRPVVYYQTGLTRFNGEILPQLSYSIWFDQRPASGLLDPFAGRLDGVIWRVTLDASGQPLFYDSIHACGCYHRVFAAQPLTPAPRADWGDEPVLFPQGDVPLAPLALRLQSGTHYLRRVVAQSEATGPVTRYALRPYADLYSLEDDRGRRQSLFGKDGLVAGSQRGERWWLWPSGVISPGAMRQWGRHAIAFAGMRHFDDPFLAEQLFLTDRTP